MKRVILTILILTSAQPVLAKCIGFPTVTVLYVRENCPKCVSLQEEIERRNIAFQVCNLDTDADCVEHMTDDEMLKEPTPFVYVCTEKVESRVNAIEDAVRRYVAGQREESNE